MVDGRGRACTASLERAFVVRPFLDCQLELTQGVCVCVCAPMCVRAIVPAYLCVSAYMHRLVHSCLCGDVCGVVCAPTLLQYVPHTYAHIHANAGASEWQVGGLTRNGVASSAPGRSHPELHASLAVLRLDESADQSPPHASLPVLHAIPY